MTEKKHAAQVAGTSWNPDQYLKFANHRRRPAIELLDRVTVESPGKIIDLGCGTGDVTQIMARRWPSATISGLDNSEQMLQKAKTKTATIEWIEADIEHWKPVSPVDLIFSNATLHWLPNHQRLFARLAGFLNSGGCVAIQMPMSWDTPSHRLMRETLVDCEIRGRLLGTDELRSALERNWVSDAEIYFDLFASYTQQLDIWETEYLQVLSGADPVYEWVHATGLRPILSGLNNEDRDIFIPVYKKRLRDAYPVRPSGQTLYPFRRLFIVATV